MNNKVKRAGFFAGLVVSVGGLAERLVMQASTALFRQIEAMQGEDELEQLCSALVRILESHHRVDRVVVPMFKFLDRVLTSGHLDPVLEDPKSEFALKLFNLVKKEVLGEFCNRGFFSTRFISDNLTLHFHLFKIKGS